MKLVPIVSAHSSFGASSCTAAPRRRSTSASTDTAVRDTLRTTLSTLEDVGRLAVGFRHRTWVSRPAGAASRFVGRHGVGDARARRAGASEYDPAAGPAVDGGDPESAVEPGLEALDVPV